MRKRNKARDRANMLEYYQLHKKKLNAVAKKWRRDNPERTNAIARKSRYVQHYGITPNDAELILKSQGGKCAICSKEVVFDGSPTGAHLDHDHESNLVRGVLCFKCNHGLGHFNDDITILFGAINYLRDFRKKKFTVVVNQTEKPAISTRLGVVNPFAKAV